LQFNYFYLYLQPILVANKACKSLWSRTSFNRKSSAKQGWCVPKRQKKQSLSGAKQEWKVLQQCFNNSLELPNSD